MKRFFLTVCSVIVAALPVLAQKDSLAGLIEAGNRKAALDKIKAGADVNQAQPDGTRPVHWAVYHVDHELLAALIAKKAKVDVVNEFGSTPLAEAVKLADAAMVKMLLDAGAGPEGANEDGQTALMLAIKTGEMPIVEMLIKAGAKVNVVERLDNQTPLMWAADAPKNAGEIVKLLLSKDASLTPRARYSDWPSQITSEPRAQYRPVGGLTALLYAARSGCYPCVEEMLTAGADINLPTPEAVTPLMIAIDNEHYDVAKLLLDKGANPGIWDWWGRTALYIAVDRKEAAAGGGGRGGGGAAGGRGGGARGGRGAGAATETAESGPRVSSMEIINALLAADVDPNPELNMHRPSRGGNSGRFVENQLSTGCTPLFRAAQSGDLEVAKALLARGANPNVNTMGLTSFLVAAGVGPGARGGTGLAAAGAVGGPANMALMDLLIQHGADVNAQITGTQTYSMRVSRAPSANEGMTALHSAVQGGRIDMVKYLVEKGANTQLVDASGRKPIDMLNAGGRGGAGAAPTPAPAAGAPAAAGRAAAGGAAGERPGSGAGRGGPGGGGAVSAATAAEIRTVLENPASRR
jgi:ankyrin repeat protein